MGIEVWEWSRPCFFIISRNAVHFGLIIQDESSWMIHNHPRWYFKCLIVMDNTTSKTFPKPALSTRGQGWCYKLKYTAFPYQSYILALVSQNVWGGMRQWFLRDDWWANTVRVHLATALTLKKFINFNQFEIGMGRIKADRGFGQSWLSYYLKKWF